MDRNSLAPRVARALRAVATHVGGPVDERDQLTGLATRDELNRHLGRLIDGGLRPAVLYVDLDDFKLVNETLGHGAGDELLRHVTHRMHALVHGDDLLARQGGDEFVFVTANGQAAAALAPRLRDTITAPVQLHGVPVSVGASIGVARAPADGVDPWTLMASADAAMYEAKRSGRNEIRTAKPGAHRRAVDREALELTTTLPAAIARDELVLHWQPLVHVGDLSILGLEALVRWEHPQRGLLAPGAFLPFAERTGLIHAVDEWVTDAVSRQRLDWQSRGLDPYVGFNLAPQFALRPGALESLLSRLTVHGLSLDHITVEVIESEALREDHRLVDFVEGLHGAGVTVALDDFGRAYSSLDRLREVPARWIKLDRAFTERVPDDPSATEVLLAILDLIRALNLEVIVEGIERPEQLQVLRDQGAVHAAQGFLLGRPAPAADLETRLWQSPPSRMASPAAARPEIDVRRDAA